MKIKLGAKAFRLTIVWEIASRSINSSDRFLVPKTFLKVVAANKRVECE